MTNMVLSRPRQSGRVAARPRLAALALLIPAPIGLCVGLFSLMMGADPVYVSFQVLLFVLLVPLLYILATDEKFTPSIVLASFAKTFFISQIISVFVWHAPDKALLNAQLTEIGVSAGLVSIMAGILVAKLAFKAAPMRAPVLNWAGTPDELRRLGYYTAFVGLPAQILWTFHISHMSADQHGGVGQQSTGAPIFSFLAPLALVSICCFAAEQLVRTNRRSFLSKRSMIVLGIYLAAILPLATKTEPLRPVVALFVVALVYRWRPRLAPVLGGLALLFVVMEFFYPAVTLTRLTAYAEQRPTAVVFGEVALKSITDPGEFDYVRHYSDSYELGINQTYFGRPMGFWDRFTPQQTDRLINGSQYVEPGGISIFRDALYELLPQSLGFKKSLNAQTRLEIALDRKTQGRGQVSWANSGYVGDGFVCGGLSMDIVFCFLLGFGLSMLSRITFIHDRRDVLWIPLFCTLMFVPADAGFVSDAFLNFWTCAIYIGSLYLLMHYLASRGPAVAA